ncbi:MAG: urease accessory protein UreD [Pseudomonadota bacterium]
MARDFAAPNETPIAQPRAQGEAFVGAAKRGASTVVTGLRQQGSAKALLPGRAGAHLEAVLLNTAGGVTGGDRFLYRGEAGEHAAMTMTTQTAERAYRAQPDQIGRVETRLIAASGSTLNWLPQETILFDHAALDRRLEVDLATDATFLACESVVFGRAAMGERLIHLHFRDNWRVRRDGRLIFAEALRIDGDPDAILNGQAALAGAGAMATALYAGTAAETKLTAVRAMLPETAGASAFEDKLVVRVLAADAFTLRRTTIPLIELLSGRKPPKVWML